MQIENAVAIIWALIIHARSSETVTLTAVSETVTSVEESASMLFIINENRTFTAFMCSKRPCATPLRRILVALQSLASAVAGTATSSSCFGRAKELGLSMIFLDIIPSYLRKTNVAFSLPYSCPEPVLFNHRVLMRRLPDRAGRFRTYSRGSCR